MAETTTFQEPFNLDTAGAHLRQRTFALRAGAGATGRISWQPATGLKGSSLYFNGVLVARGAKFRAAGSAAVATLFPVGSGLMNVKTYVGAGGGLSAPQALARDGNGALWVADTGHHQGKKVEPGGDG